MSNDVPITNLAARVVEVARTTAAKLITVESCTAGSLCTLLADTPGAGDVLLGGYVTYAKRGKTDVLGVSQHLINMHSAVSAEVAEAMADGALSKCRSATIAIAVTCVGGPKPDDDSNPVGLTYLAVRRRGGRHPRVRRLLIEDATSSCIRDKVLAHALELLIETLAPQT